MPDLDIWARRMDKPRTHVRIFFPELNAESIGIESYSSWPLYLVPDYIDIPIRTCPGYICLSYLFCRYRDSLSSLMKVGLTQMVAGERLWRLVKYSRQEVEEKHLKSRHICLSHWPLLKLIPHTHVRY